MQHKTEVLIVGAGMAGLAAALALRKGGREALLVEKRERVGGRLAGRRIGAATFDCGAQFVTARHPRFEAAVQDWVRSGVAVEWFRRRHPRWRGQPTMAAVAEHLARDADLLLGTGVARLARRSDGWEAALESGATVTARAALLTPPVPQSLALLQGGGFEPAPGQRARLERIAYDRCLAVLAALAGPSNVPSPGGLAQPGGPDPAPIAWIADNQAKGVSEAPAVTIHASAAFSLAHWDRDRRESGRALLDAAAPWLGARVTAFEVHAWRYSRPPPVHESTCLVLSRSPPLLLAGDALGGPRVEGAALSGWAAAAYLAGREAALL